MSRIKFNCADFEEAKASQLRWFPYMKGGQMARWYDNQDHIVNWDNDGKEMKALAMQQEDVGNSRGNTALRNFPYYFRRGATWTKVTSGRFSLRLSPGGFIYDVGGCSVFPSADDVHSILSILNSSLVGVLLKYLAPTLNYEVGQVARCPMPMQRSLVLKQFAERAIELVRATVAEDETSFEFISPPAWRDGVEGLANRSRELLKVERENDEEVFRLYELTATAKQEVDQELRDLGEIADHALVSKRRCAKVVLL